jgi:hypothetical protein
MSEAADLVRAILLWRRVGRVRQKARAVVEAVGVAGEFVSDAVLG